MQSDQPDRYVEPDDVRALEKPERSGSVRSQDSRHTDRKDGDEKRKQRSDRDDGDRRRRRDSPDREKERERERGGDDRRERRRDGSREPRRRDDDRDEHRETKRRRSRSRSRERREPPRDSRDYDRRPYRDSRPQEPEYRPRHRGSPSYDNYARGNPRRRSPSPQIPQLSEEQREMRSVFVSQLSARVTDRELGLFFEQQAGKVREAKVIVDRISRRSKGVGYVEFVDLETVSKALGLTNTKLLGIPIIVQYTEAEKNRQARDNALGVPGQAAGLYVGSLNFALTESDIRQVFQPFGAVELVDLHKDPLTGKSKGYAFVQFTDPQDAVKALEKMNNFPLAGREIKVGLVADKSQTMGGRQDLQLDDGTGGGNLNNITRMELMQKLSRSDRPAIDLPMAPMFRPNIPQATTKNVMLKDAFDPEEETERDWDIELRDDVKSEVESKYGKVSEIFVVKESQGEIYIRFDTVEAATQAVEGLNGRWFGGRQISAAHTTDSLFDAKK